MFLKYILSLGLFAMFFVSCNGGTQSHESGKAIEKTDSCVSNSKNSYEVYVPAKESATEKFTLLIILDSHGGGKFALQKFKQAANEYNLVLVASNLVKNGYPDYDKAVQTLIEDARQKYPVNEITYLTGFSGGARMALSYALAHPTNGLMLCGALGDSRQIGALSCPLVSVSGTDDFNFVETAQFMFQEASIPANLKIELTNESHSWPSCQKLTDALGYLVFSTSSTDNTLSTNFRKKQQARIDSLQKQHDWIKAELIARNMTFMENLDKDKKFSTIYQSLRSSPSYTSQMQNLGQCLNNEMTMRQSYLDAFSSKDEIWWKNEIASTDEKIKNAQDVFSKDMYLRIKSFWGIVCYSYCKQASAQRNESMLSKTLLIYKAVEPQNADMFYFSAFLPFWKGNDASAVAKLGQAVKAGFSDFGQMKKDFPEIITTKITKL